MSNLNAFLDKQGLTHYDSKLKTVVAGQMTIEGRTITLKSVSGATLATVTMPQTIYELATAQKDGLMSKEDFAKLQGIAAQATKVENYAALPTKDVKAGDMYNVETADPAHQIDAGMNVVWNGASWDPMAPMITMTGITNEEIDALFA